MPACPASLREAVERVYAETRRDVCMGFRFLVNCTASIILRLAGVEPPEGLLGVSITEPGGGSDPSSPSTRAELLGGGGARVYGVKVFTTNGLDADWLLVHASSEGGNVLVLVDPRGGGVEASDMGLAAYRCSGVARVEYRGAAGRVVAGPGREAYKTLLEGLARSRLLVAAHAAAVAEALVEEAAGWLLERGSWRHQAPRHRLAAAAAEAWAALSLAREAASTVDAGGRLDWGVSSAAKYVAAEAAAKALDAAARAFGGYAALPGRAPLRLAAEVFSLLAAEGTQDIQLEIVSGSLERRLRGGRGGGGGAG